MDDYTAPSHNLIEYLLSSLDDPCCGQSVDPDRPAAPGPPDATPLSEAQSRATALQVARFMDEMPGGFFIYRADGEEEILYANQALLRIFNCHTLQEFKELTGNSFRGIVHPDDLEAVEASILEQIAHDKYNLDHVEYRIIQKGGAIRWIDDYGHFIHSHHGDIYYVFAGDATERIEQQQREHARLVLDNIQKEQKWQDAIARYDQELETSSLELRRRLGIIEGLSIDYDTIFYAHLDTDLLLPYRLSRRVKEYFGSDLSLHTFSSFFADYMDTWVCPEDRDLFKETVDPAFLRKRLADERTFYLNYRIIGDTDTGYLQLRVVNVGRSDHVSQIIMGGRRLDDEIRYEMEQKKLLQSALDQAKAAIIAKDTFLANMSHDIRTPMNALVGFTALASKYADEHDHEKTQEYLTRIKLSCDQLLQLINDVLELSRIGSGKIYLAEEACSLFDILQEVDSVTRPRAQAKGVSFIQDTTELAHPKVYCDQKNLVQLILRFTDNAVKYTHTGGMVRLIVTEDMPPQAGYLAFHFAIEDNGIGIRNDFLPFLFDPFERQANTTLSGIQGTGLGLTIAKNIAELMGGTIQVSSVYGKGTCFTLNLSLRLQDIKDPLSFGAEDVQLQLPFPCRILLVEDNELNREIETELLEDAGFLVDTAEDGNLAVEKVRSSHPGDYTLILMDIQMPVMNGHDAAAAIRQLPVPGLSQIPIVALSANAFEEDRKRAAESGMNAYMTKPFAVAELLKVMRDVL